MALTKEDLQAIADLMDVKIGASEQRLKAMWKKRFDKLPMDIKCCTKRWRENSVKCMKNWTR